MSMTTRPGYYCLVQFCPNPSRLEAANLGVLVYCPETKTHQIEFAKEPDRLRRMFKGVELDLGRIDHAKTMLQDRLSREIDLFSGVADLVQFIDTRTGNLRLTHPRPMSVYVGSDIGEPGGSRGEPMVGEGSCAAIAACPTEGRDAC